MFETGSDHGSFPFHIDGDGRGDSMEYAGGFREIGAGLHSHPVPWSSSS